MKYQIINISTTTRISSAPKSAGENHDLSLDHEVTDIHFNNIDIMLSTMEW
jgi:hypothetical protein